MSEFNTITFFLNLFAVMVVAAPVFYLARRVLVQEIILIAVGAYLFWVVAPRLLVFYVPFWFLVGLLHVFLGELKDGRWRIGLLWASLAMTLAPMVLWKLFPVHFHCLFNFLGHHVLWTLARPLGELDATKHIIVPLGLSFATIRAVDLLVQTYVGVTPRQPLTKLLAYGFFPAIQVVGPLAEYREIGMQLDRAVTFQRENLAGGLKRIVVGLAKVYVLSYPLRSSVQIFSYFDTNPTGVVWLEMFAFTWYFYLSFAGFSDIAQGCARILGFRIQDNFNFPFFRTSPQAFWGNWHMSFTRFAQRNVFVPAGGYRKKTQYIALVATIMVIALWHDLSLPMVLFGVYHAAGLCVHRWWSSRRAPGDPAAVGFAATMVKVAANYLFVALSFPLLVLPAPAVAPFYLALLGLR